MARVLVTGAFSNLGAAVAERLASAGDAVGTLTNRPAPPSTSLRPVVPLQFVRDHLVAALRGVDVVVNTYWVRTPSHGATFGQAVANSKLLVDAARSAGVRRFVQVSVTHAHHDSPSPYYAGKAAVDAAVRGAFDSWSIVQPSLVVGPRDVLTSNMAWFVRRFPIITVPRGEHPLQPALLDDVAALIARAAHHDENRVIEASGQERFTFARYLALLAEALGLRRRFVPLPPSLFLAATRPAAWLLHDDLVTADELRSLRRGSLVPEGAPTCSGSVRHWLHAHARELGRTYVNDRAVRRRSAKAATRPLA